MKHIFLSIVACMALGLTSCNDWLDVSPKTSIPVDKQFASESGFKDALTGVYLQLGTSTLYAGDLTYAYLDEMAGLYSNYPVVNTNEVYDQSFVFDYDKQFLDKRNDIYGEMYNIIANINNLLSYLDQKRDVLVTDGLYATMKGEALGLRAFLHFDLLRLYGPVYALHPDGKAIAYRTSYDRTPTEVLPAREVVSLIEKDLLEAEQLLKESDPLDFFTDRTDESFEGKNPFMVNREYRMNLYAVKALLARVYCYEGTAESKAKAVACAREVIGAKHLRLYKQQTLSNYNAVRYDEQVFGITVNEMNNLLADNGMDMEDTRAFHHFAVSADLFEKFFETGGEEGSYVGQTDWRKDAQAFTRSDDGAYYFCRKFNQRMLDGATGANTMPLIRLPEMYYIIAECASSPAESAKALNEVRAARGISFADDITTDNYDMADSRSKENTKVTKRINEIMKEYRKEYYAEGQLFFFLKAHAYDTYYGAGLKNMGETQYKVPLPDNEYIFGKTSEK